MRAVLTLVVAALAGHAAASCTTRTHVNCITEQDTKTHRKPLSTSHIKETVVIPVKTYTTIKATTTVTPATPTTTTTLISTSTSVTTLSQVTDILTSTSTDFVTLTATTTETDTTTSTVASTTVVTSTVTVPTSAGFTPIFSAIAAHGGAPSKRNVQRRSANKGLAPNIKKLPKSSLHPAYLICNTMYEIFTTTTSKATRTVTKTAATPSAVTTTQTSVITSVSTTMPSDASSTVTIPVTSTISTTTTVMTEVTTQSTSVVTSNAPQQTAYAMCQSNNMGLHYDSSHYFAAVYGDSSGFAQVAASNELDCCQKCAQAGSLCGGMACIGTYCNFFRTSPDDSVCNPSQQMGVTEVYPGTYNGYTVANSNCGQIGFDMTYAITG